MMIQRGDDIARFDASAVVKLHALAQHEGPGPGVGRRLPALGDLAVQLPIGADFEKAVVHRAVESYRLFTAEEGGGIVGRGSGEGAPHNRFPAPLRRGRGGAFHEQALRRSNRHSGRNRALDEFPARDAARAQV